MLRGTEKQKRYCEREKGSCGAQRPEILLDMRKKSIEFIGVYDF